MPSSDKPYFTDSPLNYAVKNAITTGLAMVTRAEQLKEPWVTLPIDTLKVLVMAAAAFSTPEK